MQILENKSKRVTLKDIARMANMSVTTVHRALSCKGDISTGTSDAIRELAEKMGYSQKVSQSECEPASAKTGTIGLVLLKSPLELLEFPLNRKLVSCLENELSQKGYLMGVIQVDDPERAVRRLSVNRIDGGIILGNHCLTPFEKCFKSLNLVHMLTSTNWAEAWVDVVSTDYWARGVLAAEYLIRRGHRRIGFFNFQKSHPAFKYVKQAFNATAIEQGIEVEVFERDLNVDLKQPITGCPFSKTVCDHVVDQFLKMPLNRHPTGIHVANDQMLLEIYPRLRKQGIQPMDDIDIISSDNEEGYLLQLCPRPATFDLHLEKIAEYVVDRIMMLIQNSEVFRGVRILVTPTIVPSNSVNMWDGQEQFYKVRDTD